MTRLRSIAIIIMLVVIDQATKLAVSSYLSPPLRGLVIIEGIFSLTYVENTGAAFGLFQGGRWFFVIITVVVISAICYYFSKLPHSRNYTMVRISLVFICGGAIGNFIDRFYRGYVVDFLHVTFIRFPIFNFADIFLVFGTFFLSILLLFIIKDDENEDTKEEISEEISNESIAINDGDAKDV